MRCWKSSVQERRWGHRAKKKVRVGHKKKRRDRDEDSYSKEVRVVFNRQGILLYHSSPLGQHWWSDEWRENVLRLRVKVCRLFSMNTDARDVTSETRPNRWRMEWTHKKCAQFKSSILFSHFENTKQLNTKWLCNDSVYLVSCTFNQIIYDIEVESFIVIGNK